MPQQFILVLEKVIEQDDGTNEIWSQPKCSGEVFQQVFGIPQPSGIPAGETVAKIPVCGANLELISANDRIFSSKDGRVISKVRGYMTPGSWTLFQLLSDKGFKLAHQRNYDVVQHCSTHNGRQLAERLFIEKKQRKVSNNESSQEEVEDDFIDDSEQVAEFSQYSQQSDDEDLEEYSSNDEYEIQEVEEEDSEEIEEAEIPNRIGNVDEEEDEYHFSSQESETPSTEIVNHRVRALVTRGEGTLDINLQKVSCERYVNAILDNFVSNCCDAELVDKISKEIGEQEYPIQYFINVFKNHFWIEYDYKKSDGPINCECCNHSPVCNVFIVRSKGQYREPIHVGCKCALLFYLEDSNDRNETKQMVQEMEKLYNKNTFCYN